MCITTIMYWCTDPEEGLSEGRNVQDECADVHLMRVIYLK